MPAVIEHLPVRERSAPRTAVSARYAQERVAVLLNANAKSVNESLRHDLERFVPAEDIYFSRSFDEARAIARRVLDRGYRTVLTGGGDGTFVGFVNCLMDASREGTNPRLLGNAALRLEANEQPLPRIGVLKLGTGNAVANLSGASGRRLGVVEDILRARSGEASCVRPLHLLSCDGKRAPFAGLGYDAAILNDYVAVKRRFTGPMQFLGTGGIGYFCAIAGKSAPGFLFKREMPQIEVVNLGAPVQQFGPDGQPIGRPIGRGGLLYRGDCRIAAAGTVPCYGFQFKIFPHAERVPGRFQLRLSSLSVSGVVAQLPQLWRGQPAAGLLDFACEKVRIRFDREMPLQVGGDAEGYRKELVLEMAEAPIELLDFARRGPQAAA